MKKAILLYFQVHQPFRLKRYRFFDIGKDHAYFDEENNEKILRRIAANCYLKANKIILEQINSLNGNFKIAFSISGTALDQFEKYTPEVIESFRELADTGCVEFLGETYAHSLSCIKNEREFKHQLRIHSKKIETLFGLKPVTLSNTELIYSDEIGKVAAELGYETILSEGSAQILEGKRPNFVYSGGTAKRVNLLLRNYKLSDDIAFRFSDQSYDLYPITADKFTDLLKLESEQGDVLNLFMDYETFGEHHHTESGIFDFLKTFPKKAIDKELIFMTPAEIVKTYKTKAYLSVQQCISWADHERDLSAWLGNDLQQEAFRSLYLLSSSVDQIDDPQLLKTWMYLQTSDHFYYMSTKFFTDGEVHAYFNPYDSPYAAFMNYMNVLSDFELQLNEEICSKDVKDETIAQLEAKLAKAKERLKDLSKYN